jgi:predicted transposase/invertase (TIGR01784 family)
MLATKFLDPKNDFAFKKIFGTEKNKAILVHFLNDILDFPEGEKIQTVSFLKTVQDPDVAAKKQSVVDVLCMDEKGVQYIVEMQVARTESFVKRAQYYAAKAYVSQMNNGDLYENLKQIIFLAITDFVMFPLKGGYKSDHVILDKDQYTQDLRDFSFTFLELPKFNKGIDALTTMTEKWMYFFKHASHTDLEEVNKLTGPDIIIRKAYEVLNQIAWSEEELNTYEREKKSQLDARSILTYATREAKAEGRAEGKAEGKAEGLVEGEAVGVAKGIKQMAKNMLAQGIDIQTVICVTGLSKEDIE